MNNKHHPYHPIIYVRGFAMLQSEIEETVADPYMGFNIGATKTRLLWDGKVRKFFFESPLVRLMREGPGYDDVYVDGDDMVFADVDRGQLPYQSVIIYRYYDAASEDFGTKGATPPIEDFAKGLDRLILTLRDRICAVAAHSVKPEDFRVYLVAHSMGGLVCRAFLQNPKLGSDAAVKCVDKFFTYATPHNGIDLRIVRNVPAWASFGDANNFNRDRMARYLALPKGSDVSEVRRFPSDRIFNLVGTNPADYIVLRGLSSWAVGEASDGLVRIDNATTKGTDSRGRYSSSPRAFVYRSHSGHYGIVNSEEGYQNLTRFLFGRVRVDGYLDIDELTLPDAVQRALDNSRQVRASYHFEVAVSVRGSPWQMHRRTVRENSSIFRQYDELFTGGKKNQPDRAQSPYLFSVFLDPNKSTKGHSVSFAIDLTVQVPDYKVDGVLLFDNHYEGGYIYRNLIIIEALPDPAQPHGWRINYGEQDKSPNVADQPATLVPLADDSGVGFGIPVKQPKRPGIDATLRIEARRWNDW